MQISFTTQSLTAAMYLPLLTTPQSLAQINPRPREGYESYYVKERVARSLEARSRVNGNLSPCCND